MQFTRRDWRNRNKVKTAQGVGWLTVPVKVKGRYFQSIRETEIEGMDWAASHWKALHHSYRRAPHFEEISKWVEPLYTNHSYTLLSDLNRAFIEAICKYLEIETVIKNSWDYQLIEGKTERLVNLCQQAGATEYFSGPAARSYIEEKLFSEAGIKLSWLDYSGYPEYPQRWGDFVHEVTILDLLFNCGKDSVLKMKASAHFPRISAP